MAFDAEYLNIKSPQEFEHQMLIQFIEAAKSMGGGSDISKVSENGFFGEGSIFRAIFQAVGITSNELQIQMVRIARNANPRTALDELAILMHGASRGVIYKTGSKALIKLKIGTSQLPVAPIVITPAISVSYTPLGESIELEFQPIEGTDIIINRHTAVDDDGHYVATIQLEALDVGSIYNIPASDISSILDGEGFNVVKPTGDVADATAQGGFPAESMDDYRKRLILWDSVSGLDTCAYYEWLARTIDGVTLATCVPSPRGMASVDVVLSSSYSATVDDAIVTATETLLKRDKLGCQDVKAIAAVELETIVKVHILAAGTVSRETVKATVQSDIIDYINEDIGPGDDVYVEKISTITDISFENEIKDHFVELPATNLDVPLTSLAVIKNIDSVTVLVYGTKAELDDIRTGVLEARF